MDKKQKMNQLFLKKCLDLLGLKLNNWLKQENLGHSNLYRAMKGTPVSTDYLNTLIEKLKNRGVLNAETLLNPESQDEPQIIIHNNTKIKEANKPMEPKTLQYFHIRTDPWKSSIPSPDEFWASEENQALTDTIISAAQAHDFYAVIGAHGTGKSSILRKVKAELSQLDHVLIVNIPEMIISTKDDTRMSSCILRELTGNFTSDYDKRVEELHHVISEIESQGKKIVIFIDEAHRMPDVGFIFLKLIYGYYENVSIILFAQPKIHGTLTHIPEVDDRLEKIYIYSFTSKKKNHPDITDYLEHKLSMVGASIDNIFEPEAISLIGEHCNSPLDVNTFCRAAMNRAARIGEKVSAELIDNLVRKPGK